MYVKRQGTFRIECKNNRRRSRPAPCPRVRSNHLVLNSSVIQLAGTAAAQYTIERSTNLITLASWSNLVTVAAPIHGAMTITNNSPPQPAAFYRARLQ